MILSNLPLSSQSHGIPPPAVRRLRVALADKRQQKKSSLSSSYSSNRKRDSDAMMRPNNENAEPLAVAETVIYKEQVGAFQFLLSFWKAYNPSKNDQ